MNLASTRRNWPTGRGFERFYGFLGAETNQWYPGPRLRQPSGRPAALAGGGLPPHRGPHRQGARVHQGRQGDRAGEAVLPLLRARARATRRTTRRRSGSTGTRAGSTWATRRCASRRSRARRSWASSRRHRAAADQPDRHARDAHRARTASRSRRWTTRARGTRCRPTSSGCSPDGRGLRRLPGARRRPDRPAARLPRGDRPAREHDGVVVSDNGASGEGGPNGSVNEMQVRQRDPRRHRGEPGDARRARRPEDLQPLPERLGDGVQHAVQDVEALRVQRRHVRPVHHLVADGHRGARARSASSTTTRSTSSRRSSTRSASSRPRRSTGTSRATSTASACATASTPRRCPSARETQFYSMLGSRASGTTAGRPSPPTRRSAAGATSTRTRGSSTTPTSTAPSCTTSPRRSPSGCAS